MNIHVLNNLKEYRMNSIYFRLFSLFICLVFIPSILIGALIYWEASKKFQTEINKNNLFALKYIEDEVENVVNNISMLATQYTMEGEVRYFYYESFDSDRITLERLFKKVGNTCIANPYIDSIYIYYESHNEIITNNGVFNFKDFYDQSWTSMVSNSKQGTSILPTRSINEKFGEDRISKDVITYIACFPLFHTERIGAVVVNININELITSLSKIKKDPESTIFIINNKGNILVSDKAEYVYRNLNDMTGKKNYNTGGNMSIGQFMGQKMLFSNISSNKMGWCFVEMTPFSSIKSNIAFIKTTVALILSFMAILLLIAVYMITNRVYNPLTYLMDIVGVGLSATGNHRPQGAKNEMEVLKIQLHSISDSIHEERKQNRLLKNQVDQTKNILAKNLFSSLVLLSGEETDFIMEKLKVLNWPQANYIVLLIEMDNYLSFQKKWNKKDQVLWKYCLFNIAEELLNSSYRGLIFEDGISQWIGIINLPDYGEKNVYKEAKELADRIRQAVDDYIQAFTVTIGIGSYCRDLSQVSESYENAMKVIQSKWLKGKNQTFSFDSLEQPKSGIYYNLESEKNILSMLLYKNDLQGAKHCLHSFIRELLVKNGYTRDNVYQGILQLLVAIIRMLNEKGIELKEIFLSDYNMEGYNILSDFRRQETLESVEEWIGERFKIISDYLWEQRNGVNDNMIILAQDYIHNHYGNDISLSLVAEKLGYSEHQLSKIFKKVTGENFLEYLTRYRVEKAKKLIMESECSILDISRMVGYPNVHTLIRVFKKLENITPGQYKDDVKMARLLKFRT